MAKSFSDMVHQWERNRYAFSGFLSLAEQDDFYQFLSDYPTLPYTLYGGQEDCERQMLRIGSPETLGYEEDFPIVCLKLAPKNARFSDTLSHRDVLGALMNLGIERSTLGDIYLDDNIAYVFCTQKMAPYIREQLTRIKHTTVTVEEMQNLPELKTNPPEQVTIQVSSLRLDLIVSKTYHLSRQAAQDLFRAHKIYLDGRLKEDGSQELKPGQILSVRGYGRLSLQEDRGLSKKGKHNLLVSVRK